MTDREKVLAMMCDGCAVRKGTHANACEETQELLEDGRENFRCHASRNARRWALWPEGRQATARLAWHASDKMGPCAGAVARYGTDRHVAQFLEHPPEIVRAFVAVTSTGACTHEHPTPILAWQCAQISGEPQAGVGQLAVPNEPIFCPLSDAERLELEGQIGQPVVDHPYYTVGTGCGSECPHAHPTFESAWRCLIEHAYHIEDPIYRHDSWPTQTGDLGHELDEETFIAESNKLQIGDAGLFPGEEDPHAPTD